MSPSQQERVFHKAYARELLRIARQDWETARFLLEGWDRIRTENFFFTVQQSLEKTIKAVLVSLELPVPLVHDLGILLAKVPASQEPPFGYEIGALSEFAAVRRYEEGALVWSREEADETLALGQLALQWAEGVLTPPVYPPTQS